MNANKWTVRGIGVLAAVFLFVGFFQLWDEQRRRALAAGQKLWQARQKPPLTAVDWRNVTAEAGKCQFFRVDHHWNSRHEHQWYVTGSPKSEICEMLLRRAGNMLLRSPAVRETLTEAVQREEDSLVRWMMYMRENNAFTGGGFGYGYETSDNGSRVNLYTESTRDLMYDFIKLCEKCASLEI